MQRTSQLLVYLKYFKNNYILVDTWCKESSSRINFLHKTHMRARITFLARCLKSSVLLMRPSLQSGLRYGLRHCTINCDIWRDEEERLNGYTSQTHMTCCYNRLVKPRENLKFTSLRKTSLLFLASSLEVSASAVLVENCGNRSNKNPLINPHALWDRLQRWHHFR